MLITLSICATVMLMAQVDRSKLPEPGPARQVQIGDYESFKLKNGLRVFVVENKKLPRVAFNLVLDRDPILEGDKAGYISMVGQMMRRGTTNRTKEHLDEEIDFIGATLFASSSSIYGASLSKHKETLLELMTDVLFNPTFPEEELEKIRTETISGIKASKDNPDAISNILTSALVYGVDHPYGEPSTEETIENIEIQDIVNYYNTYMKPNIGYLAIVGDITPKEAKKLVNKYFKKWKSGTVPSHEYKVPKAPEAPIVALVDRSSSVQSVIDITYPVELPIGHPDVISSRVMNQILGSGGSARLFMNLREDKGYTYGAYSSLSSDRVIGKFSAGASVRNEVTDSATVELLKELNRMKTEKVTKEERDLAVNFISGSFARSLENPQTVANFAINIERYGLPKDYYANYVKNIQAVDYNEIQKMAQKYITPENAYITVVGKGSEIAEKLKVFGELKYFTMYGEEYEPVPADIPEGLTVWKILDNYFEALGGKEAVKGIKTMKTTMKAEVMGQNLEMNATKAAPDKSYMEVSMGGMVATKVVTNGEKAMMEQQGRRPPLDEKTTKETILESSMFPELQYKEAGVKGKITGIEEVLGSEAYVVEFTYDTGGKVTNFYDKDSWLKVRMLKSAEGPQGTANQTTDYLDYKNVDGIKFPYLVSQDMGMFKLEAKVESIELNVDVDQSIFEIK